MPPKAPMFCRVAARSVSCLVRARSSSAAVGPCLASRAISAVVSRSMSPSGAPGRAVTSTTNLPASSPVSLNALTPLASLRSYTSAFCRREDNPSARTLAARFSSGSSAAPISGAGHPMNSRSSGTRSRTSTTFSPSSRGIQWGGRSRAGPGGIDPKYLPTRRLAVAGSKSPVITSDRLFGV